MLLTTLLAQHPEAAADIVRHTPPWVGGLLLALTALGLSATRARRLSLPRLLAPPVAMTALALWGVQSAFSGHGAALLALWAACAGGVVAAGARRAAPAGARYDAAQRAFALPGSWLPLALMLGVFLTKYAVGVQLALAPELARSSGFALGVTALYGALSGLFVVRTWRLLRLAHAPADGRTRLARAA